MAYDKAKVSNVVGDYEETCMLVSVLESIGEFWTDEWLDFDFTVIKIFLTQTMKNNLQVWNINSFWI